MTDFVRAFKKRSQQLMELLFGYNRLQRKVGKHVVHRFMRQYANDGFTLDVGCGQSPTADAFPNRIGVDVGPGNGVHAICDAHLSPFRNASFDNVICSEVLEHLHTPSDAISEVSRVLRSGGLFILTVPFTYPVHEAPCDYFRYTPYGLQKLLHRQFNVISIESLYSEEETLGVLFQRIAFQRKSHVLVRYVYLLLSRLFFCCMPQSNAQRSQSISQEIPGPFLTAGFSVRARKKS